MAEIAPGLWRWTGLHPDWTPGEGGTAGWDAEVGCVYLETPDAVVLVDPLVPPEEPERFWRALERDVARVAAPVHAVVTIFWHARSAGEIARRLSARVWAPARARRPVERRAGVAVETFRPGERLPGGIEAYSTSRSTEVVLWIPEHRALVPGDVILGTQEGGLRLGPESWLPAGGGHAALRASLAPLLALPVERVLVSHGEPVLEGAGEALRLALGRPPR